MALSASFVHSTLRETEMWRAFVFVPSGDGGKGTDVGTEELGWLLRDSRLKKAKPFPLGRMWLTRKPHDSRLCSMHTYLGSPHCELTCMDVSGKPGDWQMPGV